MPAILPEVVVERENIAAARKSGFADYDIDFLHQRVFDLLSGLQSDRIPEGPGSFTEMTERSTTRRIIHGKDSEGKLYYRIRLRLGFGYGTSIYPELYSYRVDCFLYPGSGKFDKVIFQFYRVNHTGINFVREIRRIVHPAPGHLTPVDPMTATGNEPPPALADNSAMRLEYYERPSNQTAVWEEKDWLPAAALPIQPDRTFQLNDPNSLLPFGRQVFLVRTYRELLRTIEGYLLGKLRSQELERALIIEKLLEF